MFLPLFLFVVFCKEPIDYGLSEQDQETIEKILKHGAAAQADMHINDTHVNVFFSHFMPAEEVSYANIEFHSFADMEIGEPDAEGVSSVHFNSEPTNVQWVSANFILENEEPMCTSIDEKIHTDNIVFQLKPYTQEVGSLHMQYTADDRKCVDNEIVPMRALSAVLAEFSIGGIPPDNKLREKIDKFKEDKKEFLLAGVERKDVREFVFRSKMLDGHFALRDAVGNNLPDGRLMSYVLGSFLSASYNQSISAEIIKDGDSTETKVAKTAIITALSRFLLFQQIFAGNDFASAEYTNKLIQIDWHNDLRESIEYVLKEYGKLKELMESDDTAYEESEEDEASEPAANNLLASDDEIFTNADELMTVMNLQIGYMNDFMTAKVADLNNEFDCRVVVDELYHGISNPQIYFSYLKRKDSDLEFDSRVQKKRGGMGVLFKTKDILTKVGLHDVCKRFGESKKLSTFDDTTVVAKAVDKVKKLVLDDMEKLNKKYKEDRDDTNYLKDFLKEHFSAVAPVVTADPSEAGKLIQPIKEANEAVKGKDKWDERWQSITRVLQTILQVLGVLTLLLFFLSPIFPPLLGAASLLTLVVMGGAFFLVPTYFTDWMAEKNDYKTLERTIVSGGNDQFKEQIGALQEWHESRSDTIIEGVGLAVGVVPAFKFVKNPHAFRAAAPGSTIKVLSGAKKVLWDVVKAPFEFIAHPIRSTQAIGSGVGKGVSWAWKGSGTNIGKVKNYALSRLTSRSASTVGKDIENALTRAKAWQKARRSAAWENNFRAWKADDGWKELRILRKDKEVSKFLKEKKIRFKIDLSNPEQGVLKHNIDDIDLVGALKKKFGDFFKSLGDKGWAIKVL